MWDKEHGEQYAGHAALVFKEKKQEEDVPGCSEMHGLGLPWWRSG